MLYLMPCTLALGLILSASAVEVPSLSLVQVRSQNVICRKSSADVIDFKLSSVTRNNLGGTVKKGDPEELRYGNVATTSEGIEVDLVVTANSTYLGDGHRNGLHGHMGQINVQSSPEPAGNSVLLYFTICKHNTLEQVKLPKFYFTIFDVDQSDSTESVTFYDHVEEVFPGPDCELVKSGSLAHGLTFTSSGYGTKADNPDEPENLSPKQKSRSVKVSFLNRDFFRIKFTVAGAPKDRSRNFFFAGDSNIQPAPCYQDPPTPAPPPADARSPDHSLQMMVYWKITNMTAFLGGIAEFIDLTKQESENAHYGFTINGDEAVCKEGYTGADGFLAHLTNVNAPLQSALKAAGITKIEAHGPKSEVDKLRSPLAAFPVEYWQSVDAPVFVPARYDSGRPYAPDSTLSMMVYWKVTDMTAFVKGMADFASLTAQEAGNKYYGFTVLGDRAVCKEGYTGADAFLAHLTNVGVPLSVALQVASIDYIEAHGPADELSKLRDPLADFKTTYWSYLDGAFHVPAKYEMGFYGSLVQKRAGGSKKL